MDAVACEGSRLARPAWMLCSEIRSVDWTLIGPARDAVVYCVTKTKTNWVYALNTPIWGYVFFLLSDLTNLIDISDLINISYLQ